ncbi:PPC domain-containing protein, partial [Candidatus Hydrogenedentota bacterium]
MNSRRAVLTALYLLVLVLLSAGQAWADDHGNTWNTATLVTVDGGAVDGTVESLSDDDYFSFSAVSGLIYRIDMDTPTLIYPHYLTLYDRNGTTQMYEDQWSGLIGWQFASSGTYYIKIGPGNGRWSPGSYSLAITTVVDDHGDTAGTATSFTVNGGPVAASIEIAGDNDYFSFAAQAGWTYGIWRSAYTGSSVYLYDADGTTVLDDFAGSRTLIDWICPASGTYYISYQTPAAFDYTIEVTGAVDDHGDTPGTGTSVTVNAGPRAGSIGHAGDEDYFSFTAQAGWGYALATGGTTDTFVYLYDADGTSTLEWDRDSGPGELSLIIWDCTSSGTYYVEVRHDSTYEVGD